MADYQQQIFNSILGIYNQDPQNSDVFHEMVQCYFYGFGTEVNLPWCFEAFYRKTPNPKTKYFAAHYLIPLFYKDYNLLGQDGAELEQHKAKAYKALSQLVKEGNPDAMHIMALLKLDGIYKAKNRTQAQQLLIDLAHNHPEWQFEVAALALEGKIKLSTTEIIAFLHKAYNQGLGQASFALGMLFIEGKKLKQDIDKAITHFNECLENLSSDNPLYLLACKQLYKIYSPDHLGRDLYHRVDLAKAQELGEVLLDHEDYHAILNTVTSTIASYGDKDPEILQYLLDPMLTETKEGREFIAHVLFYGLYGHPRNLSVSLANYQVSALLGSDFAKSFLAQTYLNFAARLEQAVNKVDTLIPEAIQITSLYQEDPDYLVSAIKAGQDTAISNQVNQEEAINTTKYKAKDYSKVRDQIVRKARNYLQELTKDNEDNAFYTFVQALTFADKAATPTQQSQAYDLLCQAQRNTHFASLVYFFLGIIHRFGLMEQEVDRELANNFFLQAIEAYPVEGEPELEPYFTQLVTSWLTAEVEVTPTSLLTIYGSLKPNLYLKFIDKAC